MIEQLTLGIIIAAAVADSINPCVFGVLIFLLAYMTAVFRNKLRMLVTGLIYVTAVYVTYLLLGLGIFTLAYTAGLAKKFYWFAAVLAIAAGAVEIKDYFWYGKFFSLQMIPGGAARIKRYTAFMAKLEKKRPALGMLIAALLGVVVVFFELPCTGAPYLAILGMLATGQFAAALPLLLLYNFIFVLPLFIIIGLVYFGQTSRHLEKWRKEHRGLMRLGIGLFLVALGSYMIWSVV